MPKQATQVKLSERGYCQLNAMLGLFSLGSGEERTFLESFFAQNHQKAAKKSAQWGKLIKGKL